MPAPRQMHLGVFVLGTGNHIAGWRWPGAAQSFEDLSVVQAIARTAERREIRPDLPRRQPLDRAGDASELRRTVRAADHAGGTRRDDDACRPRRHVKHHLQRALHRRAPVRLARSSQRRPRCLECGDQQQREGGAELRPHPSRTRCPLRDRRGIRRCGARALGLLGRRRRGAGARDRSLHRPRQGEAARPRRPLLQGEGPAAHRRTPQGQPIILQAGSSGPGLALAARTADVVFSVVQDLAEAAGLYRAEVPHARLRPPR